MAGKISIIPELRYAPALMEEIVHLETARREKAGEPGLSWEYLKRSDDIYEELPIKQRERAFQILHEEFFKVLEVSATLPKVLGEFPILCEQIRVVAVSRAMRRRDEEADLNAGKDVVGVKVRSERLHDTDAAQRFLRHELMHVQDMLDEGFGYDLTVGFGGLLPGLVEIVRNRYRLLWDIFIDARIERNGWKSVSGREKRWAEFDAMYLKLPAQERKVKFDDFWQQNDLTHPELMTLARSGDLSGEENDTVDGKALMRGRPLPGSPCPLCGFPTYKWADDVENLPEGVLAGIKADFPEWNEDTGACDHCLEAYRVQAGCW